MRGLLAIAAGAFVALAATQAHANGPAVTDGPGFGPVMSMRPAGPGVIQGGGWSLACLFSSTTGATCSDSRTVTTTRSSECFLSDGTSEPANTACIGDSGVEVHKLFTVLQSTSPATASVGGGGTLIDNGDGSWRFADSSTSTNASISESDNATATNSVGDVITVTCWIKNVSATRLRLSPLVAHTCDIDVAAELSTEEFRLISCTKTATLADRVRWYVDLSLGGTVGDTGAVDIRSCQVAKTTTAQTRHDCVAPPCQRQEDVHTVSTDGWKPAGGEIWVDYTPLNAGNPPGIVQILDARQGVDDGLVVWVGTDGAVSARSGNGLSTTVTTSPLTWGADTYRIILRWGSGLLSVRRADGTAAVNTAAKMPLDLPPTARIGGFYSGSGGAANGAIRLVQVVADGTVPAAPRLFALGDSLTAGLYTPTPYPQQLQTLLGDSYYVVNYGRSGWTSVELLDLWQDSMRAKDPATVVILGGLNDLPLDRVAADIFANLQTIYSEATADGATVVALTLPPVKNWSSWSSARQTQLEDLNDLIRAAAGVTVVDLYPAMGDPLDPQALHPDYDSGDGIHLSEAGAAKVAEMVNAAIGG